MACFRAEVSGSCGRFSEFYFDRSRKDFDVRFWGTLPKFIVGDPRNHLILCFQHSDEGAEQFLPDLSDDEGTGSEYDHEIDIVKNELGKVY